MWQLLEESAVDKNLRKATNSLYKTSYTYTGNAMSRNFYTTQGLK